MLCVVQVVLFCMGVKFGQSHSGKNIGEGV